MRLAICAVGRLRGGPERELLDDYLARAGRIGRGVGLGRITEHEVAGKGPDAEAAALARTVPAGAAVVALDERGRTLSSPDFAARIAGWRDQGRGDVAFVIGGADGLDAGLRKRADLALSLGPMVWPHALARVMLAEQVYRAASILAGGPYHRGQARTGDSA